MNNPTQQAAPAAPAAESPGETSGSGLIADYDQRAAEVFGEGDSPALDPAAAGAVAPDEAATQRAARRKEIDAALAAEAARVDAASRRRQGDEALRRAQELERENNELKQRVAQRVDPSSLDEKGFFDLAEKLQVTPKKLGEWLQQRAQHPEVIAAQYAQQAVDPKIQALEQRIADQDRKLAEFAEQDQAKQATQQAYQRGASMLGFAEANAAQAPHSAAFLREHGQEEFLTIANSVYAHVPKGPGWEQHVLDHIEDNLTALARIYAPKGAPTQQRQAPHQPNPGAAKPMTTVSNTHASSRASVVDEEADWAALPYEERAARIFG